jgi:hypothetical protein
MYNRSPLTRFLHCRVLFCITSMTAIFSTVVFSSQAPPTEKFVPLVEYKIADIATGIRVSHERFLHLKGGILIRYRLDYDVASSSQNHFVWKKGMDGLLCVRWPELRSRNEGVIYGGGVVKEGKKVEIPRQTIREASFNFENFTGVTRDGDMYAQITTYRSTMSSISAYPLRFMFFAEADQFFTPDSDYKSSYWLPHALSSSDYKIVGTKEIDGIKCVNLVNKNLDNLWVAPDKGFVVCKRESNIGGKANLLRERVTNANLKELAPGVWFPMLQTRENFFDSPQNDREEIITLTVKEVSVGNVKDSDLKVELTSDISTIEDMTSGTIYNSEKKIDEAIDSIIDHDEVLAQSNNRGLLKLLILSILIVIAFSIIVRLSIFTKLREALISRKKCKT